MFWIFWKSFLSFFLSAFTVSRSYKNILSQNSQSTRRSLYIRGLNSAWSWIFFPNWINGWVLINKGSEYPSLNKHVFYLYTLKSCLWKLQVILHKITIYKLFYFSSFTFSSFTLILLSVILLQFWLIQVIQKSCHSTASPWWWLLYQSKHFTLLKNYQSHPLK